jgi:hypothetical protein
MISRAPVRIDMKQRETLTCSRLSAKVFLIASAIVL